MEIINAYLLAPEIDFSYVQRERPKRKAAIFDLDGTVYHGTFLLDILKLLFKPKEVLKLKKYVKNLRKLEREINKKLEKIPREVVELAKLKAAYEFCEKFCKGEDFYKGIHSLLLELSNENYDVYLVSYSPVSLVEDCLKEYFKEIYGSRFDNNQIHFIDKIKITSKIYLKNKYELMFMITDDISLDFDSLPYVEGSFFFIIPVRSRERKAYAKGRYITVKGESPYLLKKVIHSLEYWFMNSKESESEKEKLMKNLKKIKKDMIHFSYPDEETIKLIRECANIRKITLQDFSFFSILAFFPELDIF